MQHIKDNTDWEAAVNAVGKNKFEPFLSVPSLYIKEKELQQEINLLYKKVGAVNWQSQNSLNLYGLSLTFNPEQKRENWKLGSFGHPRYKSFSTYDYYSAVSNDKENQIKDDYLDSLGFRIILPEIKEFNLLNNLLQSFKLPIVRCTSRTINGSLCYPTSTIDGGLHIDDSPFEVLRINVSISNNGDFGLQYEGQEPIFAKEGSNLVVNTDVRHRAFIKESNNFLRTNLVIGVTPWLNYDKEKDEWSTNEFFGKLHPYDMVKQGHII